MMKIKKLLGVLIATCLFFVASSFVAGNVLAAPRLFLDPTSKTVVIGNDVTITLNIDVGTAQVFGADALIFLPSSDLTVKSVSKGDFFTDFGFAQSGSSLEIHGYFATAFQSKSGSGSFATITLTANRAAGTGTVGFSCSGNGNDTDIIDATGNNILSCNVLNDTVITFSTGATATPTPAPGEQGGTTPPTNACGGTCGSVYNCNVNLFCYQGYCRNPDCPSSSTCGCNVNTPTPKPKTAGKSTPKPTAKATPIVVALAKSTPFPTLPPTPAPTQAPGTQLPALKPVYVWGALGAIALIVILVLINTLRKKSPPKFTPPTTNVPPTFPTNPPVQNPPPTF